METMTLSLTFFWFCPSLFLGYDGCSGLDLALTLPDDGAHGFPEAPRSHRGRGHGPDTPRLRPAAPTAPAPRGPA